MELLISLIALSISIVFFRFSIGSFSVGKMSMIGYLFYFHIMLVTYIGVVAVIMHLDIDYHVYFFAITGVVSEESRRLGWYATMYSIIVLPIGMIFANMLFLGKLNASELIQKYQSTKTESTFSIDRDEKVLFFTLLIFTIITTLAVLYVFYIIGNFPLFSMLSGVDSVILQQLRGAAKLDFSGITAIRDMIALPLTPLLSYIAYIAYKKTNFLKFKLLFYYLLLLSILILTYNTEKAPVLFYGMSFIFLQSFIGGKVNSVKLFIMVFVVLILLILMYFAVSGLDNLEEIINLLLARIFVAQTSAIFLAYEYFPSMHDFLGWTGVSNLFASMEGAKALSSGRIIFEFYAPSSVANGTAGYMVGLFTAESWVLFGIIGVLLTPLWVGFFIQSIHIFILKLPKNAIFLAAYLYLMMHWSLSSGVATFIYPIVLIIFFIQLFAIYFITQMIKTILIKNKG